MDCSLYPCPNHKKDAGLQATDVTRSDYTQGELLSLFQDIRPAIVSIEHGIVQIYLEPDLGGENRDRMAVQCVVNQMVVWDFSGVGPNIFSISKR